MLRQLLILPMLLLVACKQPAPPPQPVQPPPEPPKPEVVEVPVETTETALALGPTATQLNILERLEFNKLAAEQDVPLFWREDANHDKTPNADELAVLWPQGNDWLQPQKIAEAYGLLLKRRQDPPVDATPEGKRRALVLAELRQGRPTLIFTDAHEFPPAERQFLAHVLQASQGIEQLYALQSGTTELAAQLPAHRPSHALFQRNQGPWCEAPLTEKENDCNALEARPTKRSGLYPLNVQRDREFCTKLAQMADGEKLMGPFVTLREDGQKLLAVPYEKAWPVEMAAVASELNAAADALEPEKASEGALIAYLHAAAKAFTDGSWFAADEAWAKMEGKSKWYLRIAPDETYHEPCAQKAGFHVSFALVNQKAVMWQNLLEPLKNQLEAAIAKLAGPPYKSGKVNFHLPAFIDIVLNAGDSRSALGATVGQSLPNFGPVANESRGRTVAMANLYTDPDSQEAMRTQVKSLFCKDSANRVPTDPESLILTTVLHEAGHNLGPAHQYKVNGKTDEQAFGGPLAATLEELKAETCALYLADWLVENGKLDAQKRDNGQAAGVAWAMGHIAQGMLTPTGKPKPYSQLSAVQVGTLYDARALTWHADQLAENGVDRGCFSLHPERMAKVVHGLMTQVAGVKARGDKEAAEALIAPHVREGTDFAKLRTVIAERWLRVPKAAFVYGVKLE